MRTSTVVTMVGMALGGAVVPGVLSAAPVTGCSSGALKVCAAFDASTGLVNGKWHLYLKVWNLYNGRAANGRSSIITYAGIGSSWSGSAKLASATYNGHTLTSWSLKKISSNVVGSELDFAALTDVKSGLVGCKQAKTPSQLATCYANGPELDLDFTTSTQFTLAGAVFGWHAQVIGGKECNLWADTNGQSTNAVGDNCPSDVAPEPVSMTLLGTGLVGLKTVQFVRRRRREETDVSAE